MKEKRYANLALVYAILAMSGGVFYREFTKFNGFQGRTVLGTVRTHYFLLGMVFFLLLLLLEKNLAFFGRNTGKVLIFYQVGLNLTALMLFCRGIVQVRGIDLSAALEGALSGMAGIGHILLGGLSGASAAPDQKKLHTIKKQGPSLLMRDGPCCVYINGAFYLVTAAFRRSRSASSGWLKARSKFSSMAVRRGLSSIPW